MLGGGAPIPTETDRQHAALLGLLNALANPQSTAKLLETWKRQSELAVENLQKARAANEELKAKERQIAEREAQLRAAEEDHKRAVQKHETKHRELTDFGDKLRADRERANKEVEDARAMAKQIIADADVKATSAENTARAALSQAANVKSEIATLEKRRDSLKTELKALVGKFSV